MTRRNSFMLAGSANPVKGLAAAARTAGLCLSLMCGLATAAQAVEVEGRRLTNEQVLTLLSGATLYGVYLDGRPDWAEQTAVTGQLYDAADGWREVGKWGTSGDLACYTYSETMQQYCFDVYEQDGQYFFYTPGTADLVGYTYRIDRDEMM